MKEEVHQIDPSFNVYPAMVECFTATDPSYNTLALDGETFSETIKSRFLFDGGKTPSLPARYLSCQAQKENSFGIDEKGNLFKCWNELGVENLSFGDVFSYPEKVNAKNLVKYIGHNYIDNEECIHCKVLPICMGGCANLRQKQKQLPCIAEKYCIESYVLNIYKSKQEENARESNQ